MKIDFMKKCKKDPLTFAQCYMKHPFKASKLHKELIENFPSDNPKMVLIPRGHGRTTIFLKDAMHRLYKDGLITKEQLDTLFAGVE